MELKSWVIASKNVSIIIDSPKYLSKPQLQADRY